MNKKTVSAVVLSLLLISILTMAFNTIPAKVSARSDVHIYIEPHITPAPPSVPCPMIVKVWIDSPDAWDNTANGIVGWALSVRVDPRVLQVVGARRAQPEIASLPSGGTPVGFLENFLVRNNHTTYDPLFGFWHGYDTLFYIGDVDSTTGTMLDIFEAILGGATLGLGAGGGPHPLCELLLIAQSNTDPSVIDLFGPPRPAEIPPIKITPMYMTLDGTWHSADVVDDGYYIAETPTAMYFDADGAYDPANPIGSDWHELWPQLYCRWSMESWEDQGDGVLSESDQIDLIQVSGPEPGKTLRVHIEWINPAPGQYDAWKTDLIIRVPVSATIDFDPDTLNLYSKGLWTTAYVQLPDGYNSEDVDATTFLLSETIQPVLDPKYDFVTNSSQYIVDHDGDGILERKVKFNRTEVASWICDDLGIQYGDVTLIMTGELGDGTLFEGTAMIRVLFPGDVDGDGYVGSADAGILNGAYGTSSGNPLYVPEADFDEDSYIGSADAGILNGNYGNTAV